MPHSCRPFTAVICSVCEEIYNDDNEVKAVQHDQCLIDAALIEELEAQGGGGQVETVPEIA